MRNAAGEVEQLVAIIELKMWGDSDEDAMGKLGVVKRHCRPTLASCVVTRSAWYRPSLPHRTGYRTSSSAAAWYRTIRRPPAAVR